MSEYLSVTEWATLHGKNPGYVRKLILDGRISAKKVGKQWIIPADTQPPADKRVKSGNYKNWREKHTQQE